eukprot:scaffold8707_cov128-Skeletonema_dohrnii-CCMP3373.AAC.2
MSDARTGCDFGGRRVATPILSMSDLNNERSNVCPSVRAERLAFRKARFAFFLTGNLARDVMSIPT